MRLAKHTDEILENGNLADLTMSEALRALEPPRRFAVLFLRPPWETGPGGITPLTEPREITPDDEALLFMYAEPEQVEEARALMVGWGFTFRDQMNLCAKPEERGYEQVLCGDRHGAYDRMMAELPQWPERAL
jgi:hypothetical protein